jgi:transaldolase
MALKEGVLPEDELSSLCAKRPPWLSPAAVATRLAVRQNAATLRPVFLCSSGKKGYVCLQVDPRYTSAEEMVREALYQYGQLRDDLGGVPNVVFKVPATKAGLDASAVLAEQGIGTTATVCFGLFQAMRFAEVMSAGQALTSYVVVMNGRLAGPVAEELDDSLREAGRLAGVAVAKRLQRALYGSGPAARGYDPEQVRILVASLRNHAGAIPDIEETLGVPVITVFPDIRRAFDASPLRLDAQRVWRPLDEETLRHLAQSEVFRQAHYMPGDPDNLRPQRPLTLEDDDQVRAWAPVQRTLSQFVEAYAEAEELVQEIAARRERSPPTSRGSPLVTRNVRANCRMFAFVLYRR